jgi:chemotaxis receptor (MCP) glutamine deamidase CheD
VRQFIVWQRERASKRDGAVYSHMASAEIQVAPDRFEVTRGEALLVTELSSALAVCVYDADEEAGALLHLRCIPRHSKPTEVTDTTIATELLLLHRCLEALREAAPGARHLQARIVVHLADAAQVGAAVDTMVKLVRHYLEDAGVSVLPEDIADGPKRALRFRPSMGWVHTRA